MEKPRAPLKGQVSCGWMGETYLKKLQESGVTASRFSQSVKSVGFDDLEQVRKSGYATVEDYLRDERKTEFPLVRLPSQQSGFFLKEKKTSLTKMGEGSNLDKLHQGNFERCAQRVKKAWERSETQTFCGSMGPAHLEALEKEGFGTLKFWKPVGNVPLSYLSEVGESGYKTPGEYLRDEGEGNFPFTRLLWGTPKK